MSEIAVGDQVQWLVAGKMGRHIRGMKEGTVEAIEGDLARVRLPNRRLVRVSLYLLGKPYRGKR